MLVCVGMWVFGDMGQEEESWAMKARIKARGRSKEEGNQSLAKVSVPYLIVVRCMCQWVVCGEEEGGDVVMMDVMLMKCVHHRMMM